MADGRERRHLLRAQLCVCAAGEFLFHYDFLLFSNGTYRDNEKGNRAINTVYSGNTAEVLKYFLRLTTHIKMDQVHCLSGQSGEE